MKNLMLAFLAVAIGILFVSCKKEINGSGHFVTQTRVVPVFEKVSSSGDFTIILVEDPISRIVLNGEDNILPEIETTVNGNELKIYFDHHNFDYEHSGVTITIFNPAFSGIDLQGSGKIFNPDTLYNGKLDINLSGSGRIDLLVRGTLLTSNISGSGSITLQGEVPAAYHKISGSGKIHAFDLFSSDVTAVISGSGVCRVHAVNKLHAIISGSGDVIYRGNPVVTKSISGSGQVKPD